LLPAAFNLAGTAEKAVWLVYQLYGFTQVSLDETWDLGEEA